MDTTAVCFEREAFRYEQISSSRIVSHGNLERIHASDDICNQANLKGTIAKDGSAYLTLGGKFVELADGEQAFLVEIQKGKAYELLSERQFREKYNRVVSEGKYTRYCYRGQLTEASRLRIEQGKTDRILIEKGARDMYARLVKAGDSPSKAKSL